MDILIFVVLIGIAVAGLAAVVAIWVERDRARPRKFAWALSVLILLATGVTILQSILQDKQDKIEKAADEAVKEKLRGDMARMMQMLDKIAADSGDPRLQQFLSTELEAQSRANPEIVQKLAQRYADEGEDPAEKLAKHLPKSDVQKMARSGSIKTEPSAMKIDRKREEPTATPPAKPAIRPALGGLGGAPAAGDAAGEAAKEEGAAPAIAPTIGLGLGGAKDEAKDGAEEGAKDDTKKAAGPAIGGKKPAPGGSKPGKSKPKIGGTL